MSATDRQNRLLVAKDWTKVYQSFRNADFQSYDFENIRRSMIDYLRQNFPEDFNDYIESSEYLALIDLIAYLGQSIAFRVDLNARENFLELAERRDSVLRLARMLSYNAKRNQSAKGVLKFTSVQTTQNVLDSNGRNLSNQIVSWNDSSNNNWYDQFIAVMNAAFPANQQFGNPSDSATIYNTPTEQYKFNSSTNAVPVYGFTKTVNGSNMEFEVTSTTFSGQNYIYEDTPKVGNPMACVYKNDGQGSASNNTGFFFYFTQGKLNQGSFTISQPTTSETIDLDSTNINDTDVWLYKVDQRGIESELWTQVPNLAGNNIIYNSLNKSIKNIYKVITRAGDRVSLSFSDGTFGTIPMGTFNVYYRISNGLSYVINPQDIRGVSLTIPYTSALGQAEEITITLSLQTSVDNSSSTESNDVVKANAPATYYTQNRMITAEDYNISPLSVSQEIAKIKAVNRSASGISRYLDLIDPTGKYSKTNLFADDGVLYQDVYTSSTTFTYASRTDIQGIIVNKIFDILADTNLRNFYYSKFTNINTTLLDISWYNVTSDASFSSGYLGSTSDKKPYLLSTYSNTALKYASVGSLIKFEAPLDADGNKQVFDRNNGNALIKKTSVLKSNTSDYIWAEIVTLLGDGTAGGTGATLTGEGAVALNDVIPTGAIATRVVPVWKTVISSSIITTMTDLIANNTPFGLRYDINTQTWQIIFQSNLDSTSPFSLSKQGDITNLQLDASWLLLFVTDTVTYTVSTRKLRYVFESAAQLRFYFDGNERVYDNVTGTILTDSINVLSVNTQPSQALPFTFDQKFKITNQFIGLDGYIDTKKIVVTFNDKDNTGVVQDPDTFNNVVIPSTTVTPSASEYIVLEKYTIEAGQEDYRYVSNNDSKVIILATQPTNFSQYKNGQYFYFIDVDTVAVYNSTISELIPSLNYKVFLGRDNLKFQYTHNASDTHRIDPGISNIMDVFILTNSYDLLFRQWLNNVIADKPLPPSSDELNNSFAPKLNLIKTISDEIIYHPVKYKVLFGAKAETYLQAQFKVIVNKTVVLSDNDIKTQILSAINNFFALGNWDFGDTFYFTEMASYVTSQVSPAIVNFVIVPTSNSLSFGGLFEIKAGPDEIFISGATIDNIDIVTTMNSTTINSLGNITLKSNAIAIQALTSSAYGSSNV
jgi:hypothetical protein